jgi:hypothetical protein
MKTHNWTGIDFKKEFAVDGRSLQITGVGPLQEGDEVLVKCTVTELDRYHDGDYYIARLKLSEVNPDRSLGQRIRDFFGGLAW